MWIQTRVTVRKRLSWVLTSVTLTFDPWPWPFAWTSLLSLVITPENFMMIRWWEHGEKGVTDGQTDGQTDGLNQSYSCLVAAKKGPFCTTYWWSRVVSLLRVWWSHRCRYHRDTARPPDADCHGLPARPTSHRHLSILTDNSPHVLFCLMGWRSEIRNSDDDWWTCIVIKK